MRDRPLRPLLAKLVLAGSLLWLGFLIWVIGLLTLRANYLSLLREHDHMKDLIDRGQANVRSTTEDSLGDMFNYVSMARAEYLDALEFVLVVGVIPAMIILFVIALSSSKRTVAN